MIPSETVQAAQRLLAEREAVGLKKYGTTVDRTDLQVGDWLQHAIEEASDLLLYLIRLRETMRVTMREAVAELARPAPAAAPEDAERAAYLKRWKDAPEWAEWLSESAHGVCKWHKRKPELVMGAWTAGEQSMQDAHDLLGSTRCEPRPVQGVGE